MASDPIQESLLKLIADKKKSKKPSKAMTAKSKKNDDEEKSNVVNIMDALKKSVAKELKSPQNRVTSFAAYRLDKRLNQSPRRMRMRVSVSAASRRNGASTNPSSR